MVLTDPRHKKTCIREFAIRYNSNRAAQLQKLASLEILDLASIGIILQYLGSKQQWR